MSGVSDVEWALYTTDGGVELAVSFDRMGWRYSVVGPAGHLVTPGDDLTTVGEALKALVSFLSAWGEALRYEGSENADLFRRAEGAPERTEWLDDVLQEVMSL